jgi:hypothetical protein
LSLPEKVGVGRTLASENIGALQRKSAPLERAGRIFHDSVMRWRNALLKIGAVTVVNYRDFLWIESGNIAAVQPRTE